ncbi:MAG: hypothetical protein M1815_004737 [Lichina confinis]|nr:MAG: hypothetical protein M1815_004737 [Lichina confinis]
MRRGFRSERDSIEKVYRDRISQRIKDRKKWELDLVLLAWDRRLAKFPPYVTSREQLGDFKIDFPQEWQDTPDWRPTPYCASCLKALPVHCDDCLGTKIDKSDWSRIQAQAAFGSSYENELVKKMERRKETTASLATVRRLDARLLKADVTAYLDHLADGGSIASFPRQPESSSDTDSSRPTTAGAADNSSRMDTSA